MKAYLSAMALLVFMSNTYASNFCSGIHKKAAVKQEYLDHSTSDYKVTSKGRLYFYTAPDKECKDEKLFLIPGDHVIGYTMYNGFIFAAYFKKNGDSVDGWLDASQLENTKFTNGPSSEEQMVFNMVPDIIQENGLSSLSEKCLNVSINRFNDDYYSIYVSKSSDKMCSDEKTLPFTILVKKNTLESYTNKGMKSNEFRRLKNN